MQLLALEQLITDLTKPVPGETSSTAPDTSPSLEVIQTLTLKDDNNTQILTGAVMINFNQMCLELCCGSAMG